jgi:hypothetical protein
LSIPEYIKAQRSNIESIINLPHFSILGSLVDQLYNDTVKLIKKDTAPRYGRFLLLCHRSFLSAITLIGQAQPEDAAPITRRAIEIAKVCLASKFNEENASKWMAYEKRDARWKARLTGEKPPFLPPIKLDLPANHPTLAELEKDFGMLSDAYVHFTPEFYGSQNWRNQHETDSNTAMVYLSYFTSDQRTIERELILLIGAHIKILQVLDECLEWAFSQNVEWQTLMVTLCREGNELKRQYSIKHGIDLPT